MSFASKIRTIASTAIFTSITVITIVSPAAAQDRTAWIKDNETVTMTGYLMQGEDIYGLCDDDCNDINMFLYNEMGVMVDSDNQINAYPIVTAPYDGTFVIEVTMPSCTHGVGCSISLNSDQGFQVKSLGQTLVQIDSFKLA